MSLSADEQFMIELINRARLDPMAEASRWDIPLNTGLSSNSIPGHALNVLAPNTNLAKAAQDHSVWMLDTDTFAHQGVNGSRPWDRMEFAGYNFIQGNGVARENLAMQQFYVAADLDPSILPLHQGLYESPGHRVNTFASDIKEIGVAQVDGLFDDGSFDFHTSMITLKFAGTGTEVFLTGVVYSDADADRFYSVGEGISGLWFEIDENRVYSEQEGGYTLGLSEANFSLVKVGIDTSDLASLNVDLSNGNAKLDVVSDSSGSHTLLLSKSASLISGISDATLLGSSNLRLSGNGSKNELTGNSGDNAIEGGGGDDLIHGNAGDDTLSGGAGVDTAGFRGDFDEYQITDNGSGSFTVVSNRVGDAGTDQLYDIERIQFADGIYTSADGFTLGGDGDDVITGTPVGDNLIGTGDNDLMEGNGGDDTLTGLAGDDSISGGFGIDTAVYEGNYDEYSITENGTSAYTIVSNRAGDAGTDQLFDIERLRFADGVYTSTDGFTLGGGGDDVITGTPLGDNLIGTNDNDLIEGIGGDDTLTGNAGDDSISGGFGIDTAVYEGNYDEYSITENGTSAYTIVSTRSGDAGTDQLFDIERIQFADGTLTAAGFTTGAPMITTAATAEVNEGFVLVTDVDAVDDIASEENGLLSYSISGGADASLFEVDEESGVVSFLDAPNFEAPTDANGDNIYHVSIQASDGSATDTLNLSVTVQDESESQSITTDETGGTTTGSDEGDTITGLSGDDVINAGLGDDTIIDQGGDNTVNAGGGNDRVSLLSGTNEASGDGGNDLIIGGYDSDELNGGTGNDVIVGDISTFVAGADRIEGGTGNDLLEGRGGADTFVFSTGDGDDTIGALNLDMSNPSNTTVTGADFQSGVDMILLDGFGYANGAEALSNVSNVGGVATFDDQGTSITFAGLTVADLSSDDFSV